MGIVEIILIGLGLSMDASAVAMSNGLAHRKMKIGGAFKIALYFGAFQGLMPVFGYLAGSLFASLISKIAPWMALLLLGFIGGKMLYEAFSGRDEKSDGVSTKQLFLQAIATSIDALAVGLSFAALGTNILLASSIIAATAFVLSFISVYIGKKFGDLLASKAEIFGGLLLIGIGVKIFLDGLFI